MKSLVLTSTLILLPATVATPVAINSVLNSGERNWIDDTHEFTMTSNSIFPKSYNGTGMGGQAGAGRWLWSKKEDYCFGICAKKDFCIDLNVTITKENWNRLLNGETLLLSECSPKIANKKAILESFAIADGTSSGSEFARPESFQQYWANTNLHSLNENSISGGFKNGAKLILQNNKEYSFEDNNGEPLSANELVRLMQDPQWDSDAYSQYHYSESKIKECFEEEVINNFNCTVCKWINKDHEKSIKDKYKLTTKLISVGFFFSLNPKYWEIKMTECSEEAMKVEITQTSNKGFTFYQLTGGSDAIYISDFDPKEQTDFELVQLVRYSVDNSSFGISEIAGNVREFDWWRWWFWEEQAHQPCGDWYSMKNVNVGWESGMDNPLDED